MKIISKISIVLAVAFLMLHTLLPHRHHSDISSIEHLTEHETANSLIDFLKLALHLDQGKGHLENFKIVDGYQFNFVAVASDLPFFVFDRFFSETPKLKSPILCDVLIEHHLISELQFRGPPQQAR